MRNVRVRLAYDGSKFHGWQRQDGFVTPQEELEHALHDLTGGVCPVHGASRTDAGVHAHGQVASFYCDTRLEDERLLGALNARLPEGVSVRALETCSPEFHARYDARGKRYLYVVRTEAVRSPFGERAHSIRGALDYGAIREAASYLLGTQDFAAFSSTGAPRTSTVRTIAHLRVLQRRRVFAFVIQGDGFLYNMVRIIAGTLIAVGQGKREPACIQRAIQAGERTELGATAPARGLHLLRVLYSEPGFVARQPRSLQER
ncbi:MAG: tRNA pseudouridine(38-40) synthase TruA [Planctomycetota bacterium]